MTSLKKIPWRQAMKMVRIGGVATTLRCCACNTTGVGGAESYTSASTGKPVEPEEWYVADEGRVGDPTGPYCASCAAAIAQAVDSAHSVTQFYPTTRG